MPARNHGLRRARGRNRMFIDSDAMVTADALQTMCSILDGDPAVGLVGPRLVYPDGSLQLSARRYPPVMLPVLRRPPLERFFGDTPIVRQHLMADEAPRRAAPRRVRARRVPDVHAPAPSRRRARSTSGSGSAPTTRTGASPSGGAGLDVVYAPEATVIHDYRRTSASSPISRVALQHLRGFAYFQWKWRGARRALLAEGRAMDLEVRLMQAAEFLRTLWSGRWIILATVVIATTATYVVSARAPKVYEATSTLFVGDRGKTLDDFSALQSAQSLTKTYAELIQSENVADRVAGELSGDESGSQLLSRLSFRPITETQLIVLTAEGRTARGAAVLANRYAERFIDYARTNLSTRTRSEISLVDQAQPPRGPVRPRPLLYSAIMLFVSIFLGIGLALLRTQFDRSLGDDEELGRTLDVPVLTRVPTVSSRKLAAKEDQFLEAFRILRANISFLSPSSPVRSVLITSAEPSEGKTTVSIALARVLGEQGQRVLLIEGDLRRPALSQALDLRGEQWHGLAQYLAQNLTLLEVAHTTTIDNVWLVPAGAMAPNPSVLLQPSTLQQLMTEALGWADFVIVDSPPVSAGADSPILANTVGNVLFVANAQRSRRTRVIAAVRALRQAGAHVAGLIINGVQDGGSYSYYDYSDRSPRNRNRLAEELAAPAEH